MCAEYTNHVLKEGPIMQKPVHLFALQINELVLYDGDLHNEVVNIDKFVWILVKPNWLPSDPAKN